MKDLFEDLPIGTAEFCPPADAVKRTNRLEVRIKELEKKIGANLVQLEAQFGKVEAI